MPPLIGQPPKPCSYPATPSGMSHRLADMAIAWSQEKYAEVIHWLRALGCKVEYTSESTWTVKGLTGITCGLSKGMQAIDAAPQFGFIIAGPYWPQAFPGYQKLVDKMEKEIKNPTPPVVQRGLF